MFQQAFWLTKKELKYNWVAILFTILVTIFFAAVSAVLLEQAARKLFGTEVMYYNWFMLDVLFVIVTVSLGAIFMSGPYLTFRTIKEDPYSKRMALLRTLPIPVTVLSLSRTLLMLITLITMATIYYISVIVALPESFFTHFSPMEFAIFILFWFGCSLTVGGFNPFIEYGTNGKVLHLVPVILLVVLFILIFSFYKLAGSGIVEFILLSVKNVGWPLAISSLVVGVVGCYVWNKLLTIRLNNRDYL